MDVVQVAVNVHRSPGKDHSSRLDLVVHILQMGPQQTSSDRRDQAQDTLMLLHRHQQSQQSDLFHRLECNIFCSKSMLAQNSQHYHPESAKYSNSLLKKLT